jgi:DNA (cytosine-5)-methyltransferase 1
MALRSTLRVASLFAGIGGIDLGLSLVLPGVARSVVYVEREAYAAATLVARMAGQGLAPAPIWDDVTTFDARAWRGHVDLVGGGFPCQDVSVAGRGAGLAGSRSGLWRHMARIIDDSDAPYVLIENVDALVGRGLDEVLGDLAALGFDAEWDVFSAAGVGAPHRRRRLFVLAQRVPDAERDFLWQLAERGQRDAAERRYTIARDLGAGPVADVGGDRQPRGGEGVDGGRVAQRDDADGRGPQLGDADGSRREGNGDVRQADAQRAGDADGAGLEDGRARRSADDAAASAGRGRSPLADADSERGAAGIPLVRWPRATDAAGPGQPLRQWPPGPSDRDGWRDVLAGRPDLEPALRRVAHGVPDRVDRLHALGNGVVPLVVARAFAVLARRLAQP